MYIELDELDKKIIKALIKDGRKSFRHLSREINASAPTIQARYDRLVQMGVIKSISAIIDTKRIKIKHDESKPPFNSQSVLKLKSGSKLLAKVSCDYCDRKVTGKPSILKFANFQRFFCCRSCRTLYSEKYKKNIEKLKNSFQ